MLLPYYVDVLVNFAGIRDGLVAHAAHGYLEALPRNGGDSVAGVPEDDNRAGGLAQAI